MVGEQLGRPADQARRGLVAGAGEESDVADHLVAGERPDRAVLVGELGGEQLGHEVVGGMLLAPVDVLGVVRREAVGAVHGGIGHDAVGQV
jgi:hypothetical protein